MDGKAQLCVCMCSVEPGGWCHLLLSVAICLALLRPSSLNLKLTDLPRLAGELQGSSCLCLPRAGTVGKPHHVLLFLDAKHT